MSVATRKVIGRGISWGGKGLVMKWGVGHGYVSPPCRQNCVVGGAAVPPHRRWCVCVCPLTPCVVQLAMKYPTVIVLFWTLTQGGRLAAVGRRRRR